MPRREDIQHVLVIGSGPIVIGQACEFDYSGTQACQVLKAEGIRVTLINSNPATIMTDPEYADATYIEPITVDFVRKVIEDQKNQDYPIDSILATLGGQTALNTAVLLHEQGILSEYDIRLIGADFDAISRGEDRQTFKKIVENAGGESARSQVCYTLAEARKVAGSLGYPVVVRPSFTMGGLGSGIAYNSDDLDRIASVGLNASPTANVLIEESIIGWKEYELELMRDYKDNVVVVCSIENFDPVGVHTGDSITVAPAMTLTDYEYQKLRNLSISILRLVGVDTGGCNIQFAVNPNDGRVVVIEMNPRVSRSSALASKATGFPIAKIAARLAIGYSLDEIANDITGKTPAAFEPTLDYVVVKIPRFAFEKFPSADPVLTTTMKSVGEVMAIGRTFAESLGKALRSLEDKYPHFDLRSLQNVQDLIALTKTPTAQRIHHIRAAFFHGATISQMQEATGIDPWFLAEIATVVDYEKLLYQASELTIPLVYGAKILGISDEAIAHIRNIDESEIRQFRYQHNIRPVFKTVDTCAAEFPATTPYHYSTYSLDPGGITEVMPSTEVQSKVLILGSGPNRIGQGIEFDYSCVHAAKSLASYGYETVMINCNPETVSTDYDTANRLYFEPLTFEDVLEVYYAESATGDVTGIIVQLGGQTPLSIAGALAHADLPILGTTPEDINRAEDRREFGDLLDTLGLRAPEYGTAYSVEEALVISQRTGYPVLVRPSYVLGGRGMEIVYSDSALAEYVAKASIISGDHPVLVDRFLEDAIEIDVDALCDGQEVYIAGIMEHIEEAGIHSGDSACVLPPITINTEHITEISDATKKLALGLRVRGLLNVQFALKNEILYVLEANPRASRTVPFVAKATGVPIATVCAYILVGISIAQLRAEGLLPLSSNGDQLFLHSPVSVKEAVLPFKRFTTREGSVVDSLLGPEMKATGEVMGIDKNFPVAFAKSQIAAYGSLPTQGTVIISIADRYKQQSVPIAKAYADLGFTIYATEGTANYFHNESILCQQVYKYSDHQDSEDVVDLIRQGKVDIVINIPSDRIGARTDGYEIRAAASRKDIICITTLSAAGALASGIAALRDEDAQVESLQIRRQNML